MQNDREMPRTVGAVTEHQGKQIQSVLTIAPAQKTGNIHLTIIQSKKPQSKSFSLVDGKLNSKTNANVYDGDIKILTFDTVAEAIDYKDTLGADSSICVGRPKDPKKTRVATKDRLKSLTGGLKEISTSRSKENFTFHSSACLMPLDYDPYNGNSLSKDAFIKCLGDAVPELLDVDLYLSDSTSAHIFNKETGEEVKGAGGYHVYFSVKDGHEIKKIGDLLVNRLWLSGHGFVKITEDGHGICANLLDDAVWQSTRLMFTQADCNEGLEQRKEPTRCYSSLISDAPLSLGDLPPLTDEDIRNIARLKDLALMNAEAELTSKKAAYIAAQIDRHAAQNPDATDEQREKVKAGYTCAREIKTLHPEFMIYFTDGTEGTVSEILENPQYYHEKECSDPFEPAYRGGAQVGKLYLLDVAAPLIKSQAHGGYSVHLQSDEERNALIVQEFSATLSTIPFIKPALHSADVRDGTERTRQLTETGNALRLYDAHSEDLRYVSDADKWLIWRDDTWQGDDGAAVKLLAGELSAKIYQEGVTHPSGQENFAKWARKSGENRTIKNSVELLSLRAKIRLPLAMLDRDQFKIGFDRARQLIDLQTGMVRKTERSDYITKSLAPDAVGDASKAVRWLQFLDEVFLSDTELIHWIQRFCGYTLTGSTQEQFFIFCYGYGANGKSVFVEILKTIMGEYGKTTSAATFTDKNRQAGAAAPELVALVGSRLVISSESEDNAPLAESLVKGLTSGDSMSARQLHGKTFEFTPHFKTIMCGNHKPVIRGTDHGIWRRVRMIPFDKVFSETERDPRLIDKLKREMPHILDWMVKGAVAWQRMRLTDTPERVRQATNDYRAEQDIIGNWLLERTTKDMSVDTMGSNYYDNYSEWCRKSGHYAASKTKLTNTLKERGYVEGVRSNRGRSIRGLKLISDF